jgi:phosphopantothenoylcysteine decarboxylase / phosphopantothenate---cysteine ligase
VNANPVILVGVGGGVAAYKTAEVVRGLSQSGAEVHVALTEAGAQFVGPATFSALTRRRVLMKMFPDATAASGEDLFPHLYPALRAQAYVLAPATADLMAKLAQGIADTVVTASALALPPEALRIFCPSMNTQMWRHPATQANVRALEARGWIRVGPATGALACGDAGEGRMSEPAEILDTVRAALAAAGSWAGRIVTILSGPTQEPIDPVRFIGNRSSGRMGAELARAAAARGARVRFITGPVDAARLPVHPAIEILPVVTAAEMLDAARRAAPDTDLVIHAAAVADVRPARPAATKQPKGELGGALALEATPDIAAELAPLRPVHCRAVGFALESGDGRAKAERKLREKGFDLIILNGPGSMGADAAEFEALTRDGGWTPWGRLSKRACAERILDHFKTNPQQPPGDSV